MLRAMKDYLRRRVLTRRGIDVEVRRPTFMAGERSGMWTVLPDLLNRDSVVYSFGVGDNLGWELAMVQRFGLTLHAFDPTPASVSWVAQQRLPEQIHFHPIGLAGHDGVCRFSLPRHGSRFNFRPSEAGESSMSVEAPVNRLSTIMKQLGHDRIDVLKIDIEGGEYPALDDMLASGIMPRQLLVEFHHHFPGIGIAKTEAAVRALKIDGYRIFDMSKRGLEIGFVNDAKKQT
jgi:FkbM family methyltransferase